MFVVLPRGMYIAIIAYINGHCNNNLTNFTAHYTFLNLLPNGSLNHDRKDL
jgi:hypothetical protein